MLSIGKLGAGQHAYYLGKVAEGAEDYYSGEGEAEGYWAGEAARLLDLEGKVEGDQLVGMLTGNNPVTGEPLGLRSAPGREPVPGFDLTFSAPKSVSLTWALGGHPVSGVVAEAHRAAVREGLAYLERNACWVRRGKGGSEFLPGAGFLAAGYLHRSSRAGDPQLHTHVLVANATLGPDGRWSRLYHPAIYEHAKTASYIYEAHLRHELTQRLGVRWQAVEKGLADIRGFSRAELEHFSNRRAEIIEAAGEGASARAMQIATLATRRAKDRDLGEESLRELWRAKGTEVGLDRESIGRCLGHERPGRTILTAEQVERSATAHVSHFDRRGAIQAVADNLPHGAPAPEVEQLADAFLASSAVRKIAETPRGAIFTSERIWRLEQRALAFGKVLTDIRDRALVHEIIARRVLDARPSLKADQRAMVERLLTGGRGLEVVIGEAGTGKTYATVAAAEGWEAAGVELIAAAPTWRAANVLRAEGVEAVTVAKLLGQLDDAAEGGGPAMAPGSVLLVDEAGMVDSASLGRLIEHVRASEAKLVLIGDPAQLGEIEAGGLFSALADRSEPIRLDQVIRHEHDLDREASKLIREGRGTEAIDRYIASDRVRVEVDAQARREAMVSDWGRAKDRGEDALMIAKLNSERARLNERARQAMREQGRLGTEEIQVGEARFAVADEVITRVNDQRAQIYNRERWRVEEVDVDSGRMRLAGIDTPGRQVGVDPGYLGRVNPSDGAPALEHAYAVTIYQAQGATVDKAFVVADPSMDRQEFYVAASRSRQETYFYVTPEVQSARDEIAPFSQTIGVEHIAAAAERDGSQAAAHDAALRERLGQLPSARLRAQRERLEAGEWRQGGREDNLRRLEDRAALHERALAQVRGEIAALSEPGRFSGREARERYKLELSQLAGVERHNEKGLTATRREMRELRESLQASRPDRAEAAVIDHILAERARAQTAAARISLPPYLVAEIGRHPRDPLRAQTWDRAAEKIQDYRREHGISDRHSALGTEPEDATARAAREAAQRSLTRSREQLGLQVKAPQRTRALERGMGIEL
jgi:conjugative relaxase-like TrwC/TraI family protein